MALLPTQSQSRAALFGGDGTVTTWSRLPASASPFSAAIWCELSPGGSVGAHRQQRDPELVLCIEGEGEIDVGRTPHSFTRGDVIFVPAGEVLRIQNLNPESPLVYTIIKAQNPHA